MAAVERPGQPAQRLDRHARLPGAAEVLRWNLINAWPQEWYGAPLDAMSHELAIETLVLAHEGLQRETGGGSAAA